MMGKCRSTSHKIFKDKEKNRVDDLQGMLTDLQSARKESRSVDVAVLEEQVHQMLREWKAELNEPSPASSQLAPSHASFSSEIFRLLQPRDEEDDATSALALPKPEPEPADPSLLPHGPFPLPYDPVLDSFTSFEPNFFEPYIDLNTDHLTYLHLQPTTPPPAAFLGPKCALWDCPRPAQGGTDWWQDYCSTFHHALAMHEGPSGTSPVLRPGGIGLKDGLLFAALRARVQGKIVGIPECEGAATAKSPWNAPELFDLIILEGESLREWLFFDKPRRAFESGNRKQRSLPDYNGRGWHESRKQIMTEFGGLKRSYYMDPQPVANIEWHLYEYEISKCDACALYRLELKGVDGRKGAKGKVTNGDVADLQKQMGRLSRVKINAKNGAVYGVDYLGDFFAPL